MKISYDQIAQYCEQLHAIAINMKDLLDSIESIRLKVSNGYTWSGEASTDYCNKLRAVTKNFEQVFVELESSILYMAKVSEGYQKIESGMIDQICLNLNITEPSLTKSNIFGG